jgi:hypothetical protein
VPNNRAVKYMTPTKNLKHRQIKNCAAEGFNWFSHQLHKISKDTENHQHHQPRDLTDISQLVQLLL